MTCPKCSGQMKTYDRLGVHVEQCDNCKGIFLDKGELEQIVAAEEQYNAPPPPLDYNGGRQAPPPPQQQPYQQPYRGRPDSPAPYGRGYSDSPSPYGYGGRKRKKSFFDQLFD